MMSGFINLTMVNDMKEMLAVDDNFVSHMFTQYFDRVEAFISDLHLGLDEKNPDAVSKTLFNLSEKSYTIGATAVARESSKIKQMIDAGEEEDLDNALKGLISCITSTKTAVSSL